MPASGLASVGSRPLRSTNVPCATSHTDDEHRERQRGDREVQARDAQRGQPDEHRDGGTHEHAQRDRHPPWQVVQPEHAVVAHQLHGGEPAHRGEAELSERQLARPPGEDGERAARRSRTPARVSRGTTATREKKIGITTSTANSVATPSLADVARPPRRRPRPRRAPGPSPPPSSRRRRARAARRENTSTTTNVATNSHSSVTPRSLGSTFCWRITSTIPTPMPATSVTGRLRMRAMRATTSAREQQLVAQRPARRSRAREADPTHRRQRDGGNRGERGRDPPDHGRGAEHPDADQPRLLGVGRRRPHHEPGPGAGEEHRQREHEHRDHDDDARLATLEQQLGAHRPRPVEQRGEEPTLGDVGQEQRDEQQHLGDADGGDQQHEARGVGQPADHGPLDQHADERGGDGGDHERDPERRVPAARSRPRAARP